MSLEQALAANTEALKAHTVAILGAGVLASQSDAKTTTAAKTTATKTTAAAKTTKAKPVHTVEQAQAALVKIKDEFGLSEAKAILAAHEIDKMANIKAEQADAVFAAAEARYTELSGGEADEGEGEGDGL